MGHSGRTFTLEAGVGLGIYLGTGWRFPSLPAQVVGAGPLVGVLFMPSRLAALPSGSNRENLRRTFLPMLMAPVFLGGNFGTKR